MCKGCVASELTIRLLQYQLSREQERADKFEKLLLAHTGVSNESLDPDTKLPEGIPGKLTWNEMRRKLEAADRKKYSELNKVSVPEGQEG